MRNDLIKNFNELVQGKEHRIPALQIVEAGFESINTEKVILNHIKIEGQVLSVMDTKFDLTNFKRIKVVGFGKASCEASLVLEKILGSRIQEGVVIGLKKVDSMYIETFAGTHPKPSEENALASKKIFEMCKNSNEEDLIITIVSGGGSSLLCYPESECEQGRALYDSFLKSGKTAIELNTVRKHLSLLKGGGLAKVAYPATVIGLIFSDVPGNHFESVASGPTYKDTSTVEDAQVIIDNHNLGKFDLIETPKENKYFDKVHNFVLVSNEIAIEAMSKKAKELGFSASTVSSEMYDEVDISLQRIFNKKTLDSNSVVIAAGEPVLLVKKQGGSGGRNLYMALRSMKLEMVKENDVFISFASDGRDNSESAGAIVDKETIKKYKENNLNIEEYLENYDAYSFFEKTGDMIITGATGSNVSDLMILLTTKDAK